MATLILNPGGSQIVLPLQKGGKSEPRDVGDESPSFSGTLRSSIRAQKRVVPCVSIPVDATTESAVQALFANGAQVPCQGDIFNNASATVTCAAKIASEMVVGGLFWVLTFTLREV